MEARVFAESTGLDEGSTFIVRLPLAKRARSRPTRKAKSRDKTPPDFSVLSGLRVLLVEDDSTTRQALATLLKNAGMRFTEAASADDALKAFTSDRPDLIVSDIGLPDEDGYSLIRRIRSHEAESGIRRCRPSPSRHLRVTPTEAVPWKPVFISMFLNR